MSIINKYLSELHSDALINNYVVRPSPIHGNGVFANQDFKKGDFINTHFEPGLKLTDFGKHLNHSSSPNARSERLDDNSYKTYAEKNISRNDEITLDYTINKDLEQPQSGWDGVEENVAVRKDKKKVDIVVDPSDEPNIQYSPNTKNEAAGSDTVFGKGTPPDPEDETYLSLLKGTTMVKTKIKIKEIEDEDEKDTVEIDVLGGPTQPNADLNPSYYGGKKPK